MAAASRSRPGAPSLDLAGRLGETPIRIASGPVGIAYPGAISARSMRVTLGPRGHCDDLRHTGSVGGQVGKGIAGQLRRHRRQALCRSARHPRRQWRLDICRRRAAHRRRGVPAGRPPAGERGSSRWSRPARRCRWTTTSSSPTAPLREPHQRADGDRGGDPPRPRHRPRTCRPRGRPASCSTSKLQPDELSQLALGVVANAKGTVTGSGRIDWNENDGDQQRQVLERCARFRRRIRPGDAALRARSCSPTCSA